MFGSVGALRATPKSQLSTVDSVLFHFSSWPPPVPRQPTERTVYWAILAVCQHLPQNLTHLYSMFPEPMSVSDTRYTLQTRNEWWPFTHLPNMSLVTWVMPLWHYYHHSYNLRWPVGHCLLGEEEKLRLEARSSYLSRCPPL